jgi:energy-coupling factor transporter transmembrane protein EcfT
MLFKNNDTMMALITVLLPNVWFHEGGIIFVLFGILVYYAKANHHTLKRVYLIFSLLWFFLATLGGFNYNSLFHQQYQWMMIRTKRSTRPSSLWTKRYKFTLHYIGGNIWRYNAGSLSSVFKKPECK